MKGYVTLIDKAWDSAPAVSTGRHPETGELLHETRRVYVTRIYHEGRIVKQFAETPHIGETTVSFDQAANND